MGRGHGPTLWHEGDLARCERTLRDRTEGGVIQTAVVRRHDGSFARLEPGDLQAHLAEAGSIVWLDVQDPAPAEIAMLGTVFGFHELALEDANLPHQRPKLDEYDRHYFIVFYSLAIDDSLKLEARELDLFIGENHVVTVHREPVAEIEEGVRRWETGQAYPGHGVGRLVHSLLDSLVDGYFRVTDAMAERLVELEERAIEGRDSELVRPVSAMKQELLRARRILGPERDVLNALMRQEIRVFDRQTVVYLRDIYDHLARVMDTLDLQNDVLTTVLDMHLASVSNRLNQIMKTLTSMTIILMTMALIAGVYGMNFVVMPELRWEYGYYWALGLMIASGALLFLFLRRKGWL